MLTVMVGWGQRVEARVKSSHIIKTEFLSVLILKTASWFKQDWGFPGGSDGKESACSAGDPDSIPGSGRSPGEGNGNPLQHSCLENPMDGGAWSATVHGVAKSQTRLSDFSFSLSNISSVTILAFWVWFENTHKFVSPLQFFMLY